MEKLKKTFAANQSNYAESLQKWLFRECRDSCVIFKVFIISDVGHAKFDTPGSSVFCLDSHKPSTTDQEYNGGIRIKPFTYTQQGGEGRRKVKKIRFKEKHQLIFQTHLSFLPSQGKKIDA